MIPTRRLVLVASLPLVGAIVAIFWWYAAIPVAAFDVALAIVAAVDLLLARGAVQASREYAPIQAVGKDFDVTLSLRNLGSRALSLRATDDAPGQRPEGLPAAVRLERGREAKITYRARVDRRGEHPFGATIVRWTSPLGLWERQKELAVPGSVRVYPDFGALRRYGLKSREDEQRLPTRVRRRPGGENEFERLRPYVPGDPYRHIDWRATARRGDFITREFGQEANQNVIFLIDAGRMMSAACGSLTGFDHALNAALMMGQVALRHGDRVGLLAFDNKVRAWLPPRGGAKGGSRLIRGTYDVFPSLAEPDYALAFRWLTHHVRRRSLVVLLTAVVDEVNGELSTSLVKGLAGRHLPLCVWLRDPDVSDLVTRPTAIATDPYVRAAAAELVGWREKSLAALRKQGALVVDAAPEDLTSDLLGRYLEIKARRLL